MDKKTTQKLKKYMVPSYTVDDFATIPEAVLSASFALAELLDQCVSSEFGYRNLKPIFPIVPAEEHIHEDLSGRVAVIHDEWGEIIPLILEGCHYLYPKIIGIEKDYQVSLSNYGGWATIISDISQNNHKNQKHPIKDDDILLVFSSDILGSSNHSALYGQVDKLGQVKLRWWIKIFLNKECKIAESLPFILTSGNEEEFEKWAYTTSWDRAFNAINTKTFLHWCSNWQLEIIHRKFIGTFIERLVKNKHRVKYEDYGSLDLNLTHWLDRFKPNKKLSKQILELRGYLKS